jgi:hypothetical protein
MLQRQSAEECAYGEIRSWAVQGPNNNAPNGLADAVASIGAVCSDANCSCSRPGNQPAPADQAAWNNIRNATGGNDQSNGGNFMCVGTENCWFVDRCYECEEDGGRHLVNRADALQSVGTVNVDGGGTLYFYDDDLQGWCNREDYNAGCSA